MSSILTHASSMVALQALKNVNRDPAGVQNRISTGRNVSSARDEASARAIAQTGREEALAAAETADADMEETSARLAALQARQRLGLQALSIADQAPPRILALFRG